MPEFESDPIDNKSAGGGAPSGTPIESVGSAPRPVESTGSAPKPTEAVGNAPPTPATLAGHLAGRTREWETHRRPMSRSARHRLAPVAPTWH